MLQNLTSRLSKHQQQLVRLKYGSTTLTTAQCQRPSATVTQGLFAVMTGALPGGSTTAFAVANNGTGTGNELSATVTLAGINGNVNGDTIVFSYIDDGDALLFTCESSIDQKYLPNQCAAPAAP